MDKKWLNLFLGPEKTQEFLKKYISILALLLFTIYANLRKIVRGEKLANTRNANFWENGQKIGYGSDIEILFTAFLDIIVPYKCAKFGADRFGNGGATIFFDFAWAPIETTSPIHIYKDRPKKNDKRSR